MTTNTDDIIKRLGIKAIGWWVYPKYSGRTLPAFTDQEDNYDEAKRIGLKTETVYTHSDLERVVEEVKRTMGSGVSAPIPADLSSASPPIEQPDWADLVGRQATAYEARIAELELKHECACQTITKMQEEREKYRYEINRLKKHFAECSDSNANEFNEHHEAMLHEIDAHKAAYEAHIAELEGALNPTEKELLAYASTEELFLFADEEDFLSIANGVLELIQIKLKKALSNTQPLAALEAYRKKVLMEAAEWCDNQAKSDWYGKTASDMIQRMAENIANNL